jgi:hypothetical protein
MRTFDFIRSVKHSSTSTRRTIWTLLASDADSIRDPLKFDFELSWIRHVGDTKDCSLYLKRSIDPGKSVTLRFCKLPICGSDLNRFEVVSEFKTSLSEYRSIIQMAVIFAELGDEYHGD